MILDLPNHFTVVVLAKARGDLDKFIRERTEKATVTEWEVNHLRTRFTVKEAIGNINEFTVEYVLLLLKESPEENFLKVQDSTCGLHLTSAYFCHGLYEADIHNYIQSRLRGKAWNSLT